MPHDRRGAVVQEGDRVLIVGIAKNVQPQTDYCNITVELEPLPPDTAHAYNVTLNTKQVVRVEGEVEGWDSQVADPSPGNGLT